MQSISEQMFACYIDSSDIPCSEAHRDFLKQAYNIELQLRALLTEAQLALLESLLNCYSSVLIEETKAAFTAGCRMGAGFVNEILI